MAVCEEVGGVTIVFLDGKVMTVVRTEMERFLNASLYHRLVPCLHRWVLGRSVVTVRCTLNWHFHDVYVLIIAIRTHRFEQREGMVDLLLLRCAFVDGPFNSDENFHRAPWGHVWDISWLGLPKRPCGHRVESEGAPQKLHPQASPVPNACRRLSRVSDVPRPACGVSLLPL